MTKAWKEHRDVIARLYIKENRTLDEVREIMQQDYNFKASTRSYRQHFDQWDLSKYNCKKRTARRQSRDYQQYPEQQQYTPSAASAASAVVIVQENYPMSPQSYGSSSGSMSPESEMDNGGGRIDNVDVAQSYGGHHPPADLGGDSFFQMSGAAEALSVQGYHRPQAYSAVLHPEQYRQPQQQQQQQQQQHYHRQQQ
ncbi:hypothetical protein CSAL01_04383, partial [Colletotrichum salicis]